ncbi:hypothetical protein BSKO_04076 [Bryopsis sp. KO-2023]|nr:hypothetical protein BSKO_04076 [Bryopsis sp. KO-2023]
MERLYHSDRAPAAEARLGLVSHSLQSVSQSDRFKGRHTFEPNGGPVSPGSVSRNSHDWQDSRAFLDSGRTFGQGAPNYSPPGPSVGSQSQTTAMGELGKAIASDVRIRPALDAIDFVRPFVKNMPDIAQMLPAIVVVGDQSSGKSSLLEILSGVTLPRGEGICTRVPLELQLRNGTEVSAQIEYQTDLDAPRVSKHIMVEEVKNEILLATKRIAGMELNIKDLPIVLRMTGPTYQDLTLIDLPGIARMPLRGQPDNIEELTMEMIQKYINGDSKVILCAVPANNEFVTSAALKLASNVDPLGLRTLGVVTKADQFSRGMRRRLEGLDDTDVKLKLGFVAVRCRTQKELEEGISLQDVRMREELLFETDPELRDVQPHCRGISTLVDKLVDIQKERLIEQLPRIVKQLDERIADMESSLLEIEDLVESEHHATARTHECVRDICDAFGTLASCQNLEPDTTLDIPAETFAMFEDFVQEVERATTGLLNPELYAEIKTLSERFRGAHLPNFLPHPVYGQIFKTRILQRLREPAEHLVQDVMGYIEEVVHKLIVRHLKTRFPKLVSLFCEQASEFLTAQYESAKFLVGEAVEAQSEFITFTPSYMEIMDAFHAIVGHQASQGGKSDPKIPQTPKCFAKIFHERSEAAWFYQQVAVSHGDQFGKGCLEMMFSLAAYASTVRVVLTEEIPKQVRRCLVTKVSSREFGLEKFLLEKLTDGRVELFNLMHDSQKIQMRHDIVQKLESMRTARQKLRGIIGVKVKTKTRRHSQPVPGLSSYRLHEQELL